MDSPRASRAGSRSRRKIFSCPVCDEVFIDEESLRRHELTHQNPEAGSEEGGESPPPSQEEPAPEPPPAPAAEEDAPSAVQEAPEAPAPRARPLSSVRRQAAQAAAAQAAPAQVEPEASFLPSESSIEMPIDPDATVKVQHPHLGPMGWEGEAKRSVGLAPIWKFLEDFSEWFVRGTTKTAGVVGFSVISGVGLALRALMVLAMAAACLYAGTWVGRIYGHKLGTGEEPLVPPTRTVTNSLEMNQQAVGDLVMGFYGAISEKNYQEAYDALSPEWQKEMTLDQFRNGYAKTDTARCSVKSVHSLKGGRYQVDIGLEVTESGKKHFYKGAYVAISTGKGWKLDQGNIR